ncbi:L,D-transpeptidase family protein [Microbacterium gilvum]|uniref:L,D-TPase catalytic domain-containing protein n=1 Tax=Microbacterium gilvum TaxID=1336204 RepID=A0ABP8ZUN3_9MICO
MAERRAAGRSRAVWIAAGAVAVVAATVGGVLFATQGRAPAPVASPTETAAPPASPTPSQAPTPSPTPSGFAANTVAYDLAALQLVDVFEVNAALPVDDDPYGETEPLVAQPLGAGAPVFADPEGDPVAYLPREQRYGGTIVPVVERQENWMRVLLVGRQSTPSQGDPAQVTGWLRAADVELSANPYRVEVSLSERTVDIVGADGSERIATDFASGAAATPTPLGRSYVMLTEVVESLGYTRGHPLIYLSVQSPTLDGFDGQSVAVTAFHYHDAHSGAISNGCLRMDADAIARLAELPAGTPVYVRA